MKRRLFTILAALLLLVFISLLIRFAARPKSAGPLIRTDPVLGQDLEAILADHRAYLTAEGAARRGPRFEQLALNLSNQVVRRKRITESDVLAILGDPDLDAGANVVDPAIGRRRTYAYFYDRFAHRDWVVLAMVDDAGHVTHLGFNKASAVDHSSWRPFTSATTRAATDVP